MKPTILMQPLRGAGIPMFLAAPPLSIKAQQTKLETLINQSNLKPSKTKTKWDFSHLF